MFLAYLVHTISIYSSLYHGQASLQLWEASSALLVYTFPLRKIFGAVWWATYSKNDHGISLASHTLSVFCHFPHEELESISPSPDSEQVFVMVSLNRIYENRVA